MLEVPLRLLVELIVEVIIEACEFMAVGVIECSQRTDVKTPVR